MSRRAITDVSSTWSTAPKTVACGYWVGNSRNAPTCWWLVFDGGCGRWSFDAGCRWRMFDDDDDDDHKVSSFAI